MARVGSPERQRVAPGGDPRRRIADFRAAWWLHTADAMPAPQNLPRDRRRVSAIVRKLVVAAVAVAVFLITPYFLFPEHRPFHFGAAEMRAAVQGTWRIELAPAAGPSRSITFTMDQAEAPASAARARAWIRPASACGHRTLVRSAEACLDSTTMELALVAIGGDRALAPTAKLRVFGKQFERGELELELEGSPLLVRISSAGAVLDVQNFTRYPTVSLVRLEAPAAGR